MIPVIPSKFDREHVRSLQMALNEKMGTHLTADGAFGPKSIAVLTAFQKKQGLPYSGKYDLATQVVLEPHIAFKYLSLEDYEQAAKALGVTVAAIRTVVHVEAGGDGFLDDGRCDILFERHKFDGYTSKRKSVVELAALRAKHPDLINPKAGGYKGGGAEWDRFNTAGAINKNDAMLSTSWGMFQIMGFNHLAAGYISVQEFVTAMCISEANQLNAFVKYIKADKKLHSALMSWNWPEFARIYNGPKYKENNYDTKLADAFKDFNKVINTRLA